MATVSSDQDQLDTEEDARLAAEAALIERHEHPSDATYILIALALAVVTATEVGLYYLKSNTLTTLVLLVLMALKFAIVVGYFMHLKFDNRILRRLFVGGLGLAILVYTAYLLTLGIFVQPPHPHP